MNDKMNEYNMNIIWFIHSYICYVYCLVLSFMGNVFGEPKSLKEVIRENQRTIKRAIRSVSQWLSDSVSQLIWYQS